MLSLTSSDSEKMARRHAVFGLPGVFFESLTVWKSFRISPVPANIPLRVTNKIICHDRKGHITSNLFHVDAMISS